MQKGTIGAAKIGGSIALLLVAVIFSIYFVIPALAAHGDSNGPQFFFNATSNTSYQYQPSSKYGFQVNITNETGVYGTIRNVTFELGRPSGTLTNYTNYSSILVQNYTNLSFINFTQEQLGPAGTYNYTWYANDTAPAVGKWNKTQTVAFTVSANSTTPVLNFPTPANASYIYGTSAQLFQINITDKSKAAANNATLYYKVNTTDTWSTAAIYCFYGTPNYVCNTTVNIAGSYLENDKIQYFFNMSDANYTGIGTNGTAASPLSVIIDQTPPRSSNVGSNDTDNIIAKGAGINLSVRWTDNYGLNNATLSINVSGTEAGWRNITNAFGSPLTLSGAADWSNFTFSNSSLVAGTVVQWKVYVNDQVLPTRNENVSAQGEFTIDGTAPTASGNVTSLANGTTYNTANNYGFQINWTDTVAVSNVTFDLGRPDGTKTNYTNATTPGVVKMGDTYYVNLTQHQLGPAGTYNFTWLANDTSNNFRWDSIMPYVIVPAAAPVVTLQLNGTEGNRTYNKSDVINQSATSSISGLTVTLYNNMSGTLAAIGNNISTINVTNVTTSLTLGTYRVLANVTSNENYTANVTGVTYFITLTDGIAPTMRIFNATSGAQLFNNTRVTNGTSLSLNITVSDNDVFSNSFNASVYIGTTFAGNITNVSVNAANGTITIPNGLANGNLTLNVSITDASGNAAYNTTFTVDVDNIAPVLRYVTPADNSYITGSSAELFQTNVTEANLDSTKNVTLNYKRQGIASWAQKALACYDAAGTEALASGPFKCNTTVNLEGFGSGWLIQYYFNTTDLAGNTGNNGTATNWLNTTIDRTNPQFIANASSPATYQNYSTSANYGFQINWTNGDIDKVTFQLGRASTGVYTNYTTATTPAVSSSGNTYYINFTQAAFGPSGIYNITWFANDTAGNANTTQTWNYQIYNATNVLKMYLINSTSQYLNQNITITYETSVTMNASATIGTVYLYRNGTQVDTGNAAVENATETQVLGAGVWEINASVISNNANYSDNRTANITYYVTVNKAGITNYLNLQINGTGADSVRAYPNVTNVTGWSNVTGQTDILFALYRNGANMTLNASSPDYNRTEVNMLGFANYTYIYNTTGNANYTSGSITRVLNITKGTPALGLFINSTSGNQTYVYAVVTRTTANNTDIANTDGVYELYRNNTNLTGSGNNSNVTLAAGVYLFVHNVTAGTNYTSGTTSVYLTISKAATNISLYLNGTQGNVNTYNRYDIANFTAKLNVTNKNVSIYVNGTLLNTSTDSSSRLENTTNLTAYAVYNVTAYFAGDENYTTSVQQYNATTIDTTGPTVYVYNSTAQPFLNLTARKSNDIVILNISASDSGVGISNGALCAVTVGGVAAGSISYSSGWCNGTITVPAGSGVSRINITINDTNNNTGFNDSYVFNIDNTPPVLALAAPSNLSYVKVNADGYVWINGTVYDLIGMGVTNVTVGGNNASLFQVWSFNGTNNTAFTIRNTSAVGDGLVNLTLYYNDSVNNTGSMVVYIYEDNNGPSAAVGLTNSTTNGYYAPSSSQTMQVAVTDNLKTNDTITLKYWTGVNSTKLTATMSGTPGASTVYTTTINTIDLPLETRVYYYITGTDNATNPITVGGSDSSPLNNFTVSSANDSTAPTISFAAPTNSTNVTTTTPTITFSVEEDVADNIRDISVSGVNGFSKTGNYTGGNAWKGTYSFKPTALTNGQNYTISVTATNKVGLSSTSSIIVGVDTTKGVTASLISSDTSGVADNNYANGWSYTFNITLGTGVNRTRVKLDNFTMTTDSTKTIGVPGNVIMNYTNASGYAKSYNVLESYNESATIDPLFDLDSSAAGVQGNVTIYVKIPSGTVAGAYSTAYTFGSYTV